ncbi:Hypothetical_protein [Hexamita inflata]|uniref:Hypothetical_protein n=1 Tax=Hexamita inflata TaxID=28002 RepID=A0AA86VSA7_9EUKA|nr:Hypothetical protein HINF_LOCUS63273 [Hexamita inflata]
MLGNQMFEYIQRRQIIFFDYQNITQTFDLAVFQDYKFDNGYLVQTQQKGKQKTIFEKYYMYIIIGGTAAGTAVLCVTIFSIIICRIKHTQLGKKKVKGVTLVF